ncbi:MAG: gliding motility-associated C-terminal domain-containing protein [Bacteroidia bacterium]|nr:gliding motility-associated C-terminal domain-containing protein [Bacteroidia bacterium]
MKRAILIFFTAIAVPLCATHIVGGEIYYTCLGNNNYEITLKVYRDCYNGQAPYDNPASIGIYDINGVLIQNVLIPYTGSDTMPLTLNNPCFIPPTNVCVEEAVYRDTVNLPPLTGGYTLVYQRCCRNSTILNIINPLTVGSSISVSIPDPSLATCNSSPRYDSLPPLFMCTNVPFLFNHSATDPDGDSLAYKFCDPWDGASQVNPMPQPPAPPPYNFVPWQPPYNATYPIASSPAFTVNVNSGVLSGTPNLIGNWVAAVCVEEWRNGQLLSVNKRDYQFNVLNCPGLVVSSVPPQVSTCASMTINFANNSTGATSYFWNFGDPTTTGDTSSLFSPTWTYSDTGTYTVMLIGNPGSTCADTGYATVTIYPLLDPSFIPPTVYCENDSALAFAAQGLFLNNATFTWNFGPNANPTTATGTTALVTFTQAGTYVVTLTVNQSICTETFTDTVYVTDLDCEIPVPNVITPNGDQFNENLEFQNLENFPGSRLVIYNRWGNKLYDNPDYKNDYNGKNHSDGVYYFILYVSDGRVFPGFFQILRG